MDMGLVAMDEEKSSIATANCKISKSNLNGP